MRAIYSIFLIIYPLYHCAHRRAGPERLWKMRLYLILDFSIRREDFTKHEIEPSVRHLTIPKIDYFDAKILY